MATSRNRAGKTRAAQQRPSVIGTIMLAVFFVVFWFVH